MQKSHNWIKRWRTIGYIRVSTSEQDTEKNKAAILMLANKNRFGTVEFVEEKVSGKKSWKERKLKRIIDELDAKDHIIVPEI